MQGHSIHSHQTPASSVQKDNATSFQNFMVDKLNSSKNRKMNAKQRGNNQEKNDINVGNKTKCNSLPLSAFPLGGYSHSDSDYPKLLAIHNMFKGDLTTFRVDPVELFESNENETNQDTQVNSTCCSKTLCLHCSLENEISMLPKRTQLQSSSENEQPMKKNQISSNNESTCSNSCTTDTSSNIKNPTQIPNNQQNVSNIPTKNKKKTKKLENNIVSPRNDSYVRPNDNHTRPNFNHTQPSMNQIRMNGNYIRPENNPSQTYNGEPRGIIGYIRPNFNQAQLNDIHMRPNFYHVRPNLNQVRQSFDHFQATPSLLPPNALHNRPQNDQYRPNSKNSPTVYNQVVQFRQFSPDNINQQNGPVQPQYIVVNRMMTPQVNNFPHSKSLGFPNENQNRPRVHPPNLIDMRIVKASLPSSSSDVLKNSERLTKSSNGRNLEKVDNSNTNLPPGNTNQPMRQETNSKNVTNQNSDRVSSNQKSTSEATSDNSSTVNKHDKHRKCNLPSLNNEKKDNNSSPIRKSKENTDSNINKKINSNDFSVHNKTNILNGKHISNINNEVSESGVQNLNQNSTVGISTKKSEGRRSEPLSEIDFNEIGIFIPSFQDEKNVKEMRSLDHSAQKDSPNQEKFRESSFSKSSEHTTDIKQKGNSIEEFETELIVPRLNNLRTDNDEDLIVPRSVESDGRSQKIEEGNSRRQIDSTREKTFASNIEREYFRDIKVKLEEMDGVDISDKSNNCTEKNWNENQSTTNSNISMNSNEKRHEKSGRDIKRQFEKLHKTFEKSSKTSSLEIHSSDTSGKPRSMIKELKEITNNNMEQENDVNKEKSKNIEQENEVKKTISQSIEYENDINKIKANSNDHEKDRSKIRSKNIEHENELRKTESQSMEYENGINKIKANSNDHEKDRSKIRSKNIEHENELRKTESQSIEYENGINKIKANSNDHENDRGKIRSKNIEHENELRKTVSQSIEYENGINKIKANSNDHEKDRSKIRSKNVEHENELRKTESQSIEYENDINKTKLISNDHEKDRSKIRSKNIEHENELRKTVSRSIEYENGINKTKANSNDHENDRSKIRSKNIEHENELRKTESQSMEYENGINKIKANSNDHEKDRSKIRSKNIEHENELRKTVSQSIEYENDINKTKSLSNDHEKDRSKIESKNIEHENDANIMKLQNTEQENDFNKKELKNGENEGDVSKIKPQNIEQENGVCEKANEIKVNNNIRSKNIEGRDSIKNKAELNHMERKDQANNNIKSINVENKIIFRYEIKPRNIKRLDIKGNVSHEKRFICNISNSIEQKDNLKNVTNRNSDRVLSNDKASLPSSSSDVIKNSERLIKSSNGQNPEKIDNSNTNLPLANSTQPMRQETSSKNVTNQNSDRVSSNDKTISETSNNSSTIDKHDKLKKEILPSLSNKKHDNDSHPIRTDNKTTNIRSKENASYKNIYDDSSPISSKTMNRDDFSAQLKTNFLNEKNITDTSFGVSKSGVQKNLIEQKDNLKPKMKTVELKDKMNKRINNNEMINVGNIKNIAISDKSETIEKTDNNDSNIEDKDNKTTEEEKLVNKEKLHVEALSKTKKKDENENVEEKIDSNKNNIIFNNEIEDNDKTGKQKEHLDIKLVTKLDVNLHKNRVLMDKIEEVNSDQGKAFDNKSKAQLSETCIKNSITTVENLDKNSCPSTSDENCHLKKSDQNKSEPGTIITSLNGQSMDLDKHNDKVELKRHQNTIFDHNHNSDQVNTSKTLCLNNKKTINKTSELDQRTLKSFDSSMNTKPSNFETVSDTQSSSKIFRKRFIKENKTDSCCQNKSSNFDHLRVIRQRKLYKLLSDISTSEPLYKKSKVQEKTIGSMKSVPLDTKHNENKDHSVESDHAKTSVAKIVPKLPQNDSRTLEKDKTSFGNIVSLPDDVETCNNLDFYNTLLLTVFENTPLLSKDSVSETSNYENIAYNVLNSTIANIVPLMNIESKGNKQSTNEELQSEKMNDLIVEKSPNYNELTTENTTEKYMVALASDKNDLKNENTTENIVTLSRSNKDIDGLKNKDISKETIGTLSNSNQVTDELPTKDTEKETIVILSTSNENMNIINTENTAEKDIVKSSTFVKDKDEVTNKNTTEKIVTLSHSKKDIDGLKDKNISKETIGTSNPNQVTDELSTKDTEKETIVKSLISDRDRDKLTSKNTSDEHILMLSTSNRDIHGLIIESASKETVQTLSTSNQVTDKPISENTKNETVVTLSTFSENMDLLNTEKTSEKDIVKSLTSDKDIAKLTNKNTSEEDIVTFSTSNENMNERTIENISKETIGTLSNFNQDIDAVTTEKNPKEIIVLPLTSKKDTDKLKVDSVTRKDLVTISISKNDINEPITKNTKEENISTSSTSYKDSDKHITKNVTEKDDVAFDKGIDNFPAKNTIGENLIRLSTSDKDVSEVTTENTNEANIKVSSTSKDVNDKFVSENSKEKVIHSIDISSGNANNQLFPTSDTIVTLCTSNLNESHETPLSCGQKWMKRINDKNSSSPFSDIKFDGKYVSLSLNVKKRLGKIIDSALIDNYDTIVELENTIKDSICQKLFQNLNVDSPLSPKVSRTEGNDSYHKTDDTDVLEIKIKQEICDDTPTEISDQEDSLVTNYLKAKTRPCFVKLIDYKKNPLDGINIKTEPSDNGNDNDEVFGNKTNHREDSVEILLEKQQRLKKKRKHYSLCSCSDDGDRDCYSCKQSVECSETKTKKMKKCKCKGEKRRKSAGDVLHSKEKKSHNGNVDPIKFRLMQEKWRNIFG